MNHINFLEKKGFDFRRIEFNYLFILLACGAFLFFMIAYGLIQKIRLDAYQNRLSAKLSQIKSLQDSGGTAATEEAGASQISFFPEKRIVWSPLLNALGAKAAEGVWIQSLSGLSETGTLEIEGGGAYWHAVSRFQKGLEAIGSFEKVSLLSSETAPNGTIVFKIQGYLK